MLYLDRTSFCRRGLNGLKVSLATRLVDDIAGSNRLLPWPLQEASAKSYAASVTLVPNSRRGAIIGSPGDPVLTSDTVMLRRVQSSTLCSVVVTSQGRLSGQVSAC